MSTATPDRLHSKANERRFFRTMHDRFTARLKDSLAEIQAEQPDQRDWSEVEQQFLFYGFFLEQEPDALAIPLPAKRKIP